MGPRQSRGSNVQYGRQCVLGVCAMKKKTNSKPMIQILDRIRAYGEFQIIVFTEEMILNDPPDTWPCCDCLICFSSAGFPLAKAIEYVNLRKSFCVNDVPSQVVLNDRFQVYRILTKNNIPTAKHLLVDRKLNKNIKVQEYDEYIEIDGEILKKPVVEKPRDGDDHNVIIYYPESAGGGSRRLFRKVGNRSSRFYPKCRALRKNGSYVYEELLEGGYDLKVYTLGPAYGHGEMRKSPAVDGIVERDPDGKELRLLSKLTTREKEIATKAVTAFKQNICGFDIIRVKNRSFVIDVNGWSFVKGNQRYYDKCARIIRKMCLCSPQGRKALTTIRAFPLTPDALLVDHNAVAEFVPTPPFGENIFLSEPPHFALGASLSSPSEIASIQSIFADPHEHFEEESSQGASTNIHGDKAKDTGKSAFPPPVMEMPPTQEAVEEALSTHVQKAGGTRSAWSSSFRSELPLPLTDAPNAPFNDPDNNDVLRGLVAVFRHADRTPKQKLKIKVGEEEREILEMLPMPTKEVKLKKSKDLEKLLATLTTVIDRRYQALSEMYEQMSPMERPKGEKGGLQRDFSAHDLVRNPSEQPNNSRAASRSELKEVQSLPRLGSTDNSSISGFKSSSERRGPSIDEQSSLSNLKEGRGSRRADFDKGRETLRQLQQVALVLERKFSNIKVQLKPKKWDDPQARTRVVEVLVVCKWGGEITHAGIDQVREYAPVFWDDVLGLTRDGSDLVFNDSEMEMAYDSNNTVSAKDKEVWMAMLKDVSGSGSGGRIQLKSRLGKVGKSASMLSPAVDKETRMKQKLAFIHGMRLYSSDEPRVYATAKAFYISTYLDAYGLPPNSTSATTSASNTNLNLLVTAQTMPDEPSPRDKKRDQSKESPRHSSALSSLNSNTNPTSATGGGGGSTVPVVTLTTASSDNTALIKAIEAAALVRIATDEAAQTLLSEVKKCSSAMDISKQDVLNIVLSPIQRSHKEVEQEILLREQDSSSSGLSKEAQEAREQQKAQVMNRLREKYLEHIRVKKEKEEQKRREREALEARLREQDEAALTVCEPEETSDDKEKDKEKKKKDKDKDKSKGKKKENDGEECGGNSDEEDENDPNAMTSWGIRCLRWLGVPRDLLRTVYDMMLDIQKQIASKIMETDALMDSANCGLVISPHSTGPGTDGGQSSPSHAEQDPTKQGGANTNSENKELKNAEYQFGIQPSVVSTGKKQQFPATHLLCHNETLILMKNRWDKLVKDFYDPKTDSFDPTKVPDIYDSIKYDVIHNSNFLRDTRPLYRATQRIADFVVPQEYGVIRKDKLDIGRGVIQPLLHKIVSDLQACRCDHPPPPTRVSLYFTSESHLHALRNVVLLSALSHNKTVATVLEGLDLNYLSHGVFRLYENLSKPTDDPERLYVNIQFSPGAALDPFIFTESAHVLPVSRPVPVNARVPFSVFSAILNNASRGRQSLVSRTATEK